MLLSKQNSAMTRAQQAQILRAAGPCLLQGVCQRELAVCTRPPATLHIDSRCSSSSQNSLLSAATCTLLSGDTLPVRAVSWHLLRDGSPARLFLPSTCLPRWFEFGHLLVCFWLQCTL